MRGVFFWGVSSNCLFRITFLIVPFVVIYNMHDRPKTRLNPQLLPSSPHLLPPAVALFLGGGGNSKGILRTALLCCAASALVILLAASWALLMFLMEHPTSLKT